MRIALLADIHGNSIGLEAVLDDIQERGGVDGYWILGDLCAIGYDPVRVLEQIDALPNTIVIRGNTDRYVSTLDLPPPSLEEATDDPSLIPIYGEVIGNFSWTRGVLDHAGWTHWMQNLPFEHRLTLPDGTQVLLIHARPTSDDGRGLNPSLSDDDLANELAGVQADLICVGHFHTAMRRYFRGKQIVNPGSVSNSFLGDKRGFYAILTADTSGYDLAYYAVPYNTEKAIEACRRTTNVGRDYNIRAFSGEIRAHWTSLWDGKSHFPPIEG